MPRVSILCPTHDHEAFLQSTVDSVLDQSFGDWELIILDDGSSDRTLEIAHSFSDPRIRVIAREHQGIQHLADLYNAGLQVARGELIGILEGDDLWPTDKLKMQVPDFDDAAVALSFGFTRIMEGAEDRGTTPHEVPSEAARSNRPVGAAFAEMADPDNLTYTFPVSVLIRKSALEAIGGFQQPPYLPLVDLPTFLRITQEGEFRFHPVVTGIWRRHRASVTSNRFSTILEGAFRLVFETLQKQPGLLSAAQSSSLLRRWRQTAAQRCLLRGRMLASQGDRRAARAFRETFQYAPKGKTWFAAALGWALSVLRLPVEPVFLGAGRRTWHEEATLPTGECVVHPSDMDRPRYVPIPPNS